MLTHTPRFIAGLILLLTNQIVGWGGIILSVYWARKKHKKMLYVLGIVLYVFSWLMVVAGAFLAGQEGVVIMKHLYVRYGLYSALVFLAILPGIWFLLRRRGDGSRPAPSLPIKS